MTASFPAESGRTIRLTMIGLLVFAVLQVCWWLYDQARFTQQTTDAMYETYAADLMAARRLQALGVDAPEIVAILPHLTVDSAGKLVIAGVPALNAMREKHIKQYTWESGFFLLVLGGCIAVLWWGLREEREVRRQQDNFLALVSHQFKTPLASLRLSAETLVKRAPEPEYARALSRRMIEDVGRLERMVTKILDSARLEGGRVDFQKTRVDLSGAAEQILANLAETARDRGVILENRVPPRLQVWADPIAVDTVLRNLVENAIAATAGTNGTVTLKAAPAHDGIAVSVSDTGVGFPPAEARRLFDKFHSRDTGDRQSNGGTGLGLFIVARIMHFENGRAEAHSPGPGQGATFSVIWPAVPEASPS